MAKTANVIIGKKKRYRRRKGLQIWSDENETAIQGKNAD